MHGDFRWMIRACAAAGVCRESVPRVGKTRGLWG